MKRRSLWILLALLLLLGALSRWPLLLGGRELPEESRKAVLDQASGLYSSRLPLIPVCVNVESQQGDTVFYSIHYFPFGTVGMSYHGEGGYNMEKALTRLQ